MRTVVALLMLVLALPEIVRAEPGEPAPLVVVLAPTGRTRDGLPVFERRAGAVAIESALTRGYSGRLLRLFRWEQQFLARRDGTRIEPAYLLLSRTQGGFPRFGFWLGDESKSGVGYVDLHERSPLSGQFGALDQIFPHELLHVIVRQLAGDAPAEAGGANQVHAVGVRTDRLTAFNEGFAEHAQVLAVDDADAAPATAALARDAGLARWTASSLDRYERALTARVALAPPSRLGFLLWFSQAEQVLRYQAVKANAFAHEVAIPPALLASGKDPYPAYLLENVLPGRLDAPFKSTPRLLDGEGAVASLFVRWVTDPALQGAAIDEALADRFGVRPEPVPALERAYLKLFAVLADRRPHDTRALVEAYVESYPGEASAVARVMTSSGFAWPLPDAPELWLANADFRTGTSLFDQYRGIPRVHTFDLNAASEVDLMTVAGMTREVAASIRRHAPFASIDELRSVPGVTSAMATRFREMRSSMPGVRAAGAGEDIEDLDLSRLVAPALRRAAAWALVAWLAAAWCYRRVRPLRLWRVALNGLAAATMGLASAWMLGAALRTSSGSVEPAALVFLPIVCFGLPAAVWQLIRHRASREAARVLVAWTCACLPALLIVTPSF